MTDLHIHPTNTDDGRAAANPISLAHVLALSVPVHWTESVAVIEALCLTLTASGESALVPEAADVLITAQGTVIIPLGAPATADVDGLGRLLNTLLDPVTTPIPLRLFVAHSIGSEKYRSVAAYAEALAYYARPDRAELIQALYRRCLESKAMIAPAVEDPPRVEAPPPAPPPPLVNRRKVPQWVAIAAALLVLLTGSYLAFRRFAHGSAATPVRTLAAAASTVVQSVRRFITPAHSAAPGMPSAPVERGTPGPTRSRRASRGDGDVQLSSQTNPSAEVTVALDGGPLSESEAFLPASPLEARSIAEGALALPPVATSVPGMFSDPTVYTKASLDVKPPVLFSPKLPPVPPVEPDLLGTNTMELSIDETGAVQQVLLKSKPVRLPDMLLLSAAKTWQFYPALKEGRPVKYRLSLSWVVAPP